MKIHSYTFNSKTIIYLITFGSLLLFFSIILSDLLLKKIDDKYYNFFNNDYLDKDIILIGNSRTVKLDNYSEKEILNLSYNELTQDMAFVFLDTIKNKSNYKKKKIYIEITSLQKGKINCNFLIYSHLKNFNNEKFKHCEKNVNNKVILPYIKFNSEILQRIIIEKIINKNEISHLTVSKKICKNNYQNPYIKYYESENNLLDTIDLIDLINDNYNNVIFIITPFINGYDVSKKIENQLLKKNINTIQLTKFLGENFYNNCKNFWDKVHYNHKSAKKISKIIWKN
jgi:hypothetical protein